MHMVSSDAMLVTNGFVAGPNTKCDALLVYTRPSNRIPPGPPSILMAHPRRLPADTMHSSEMAPYPKVMSNPEYAPDSTWIRHRC